MKNLKLFIGYVICGGFATVVDIGFLYGFTEFLGIWYFYSAALSYFMGMLTNYSLNRYFNFKNKSKKIVQQFGIFASVALIGLLLNQFLLYSLVEWASLWYIYAKFISTFLVMLWSFYGHKKFTFEVFK